MKKLFAIALSLIMIICVFAGCSSTTEEESTSSESTSVTVQNPTDDAVIKESDAINFIKEAYTAEELGLDDVDEEYSFMVASSGVEIDDAYYIKVAANIMEESDVTSDDGKTTYSLTPVGEYYISYDGETVLMKDLDTDEYTKLENRYQDYKEKSEDADITTADQTE